MIDILKVIHYFWLMFLKIHHLDPVKCLSGPGLAWQALLKKTEVKLELLTDKDVLLMVGKEEEYVMQLINIQKLITNM